MVSGIADRAADLDRSEDGIDDEPGNSVGGITALSWLTD
jgi:hypothetical protein